MEKEAHLAHLPIVDMTKVKDPAHRMDVAREVVRALETVGFLFIDNIPGVNLQTLLKHTEKFFSLTEAEKNTVAKHKWNKDNKNIYRGYFPAIPGDSSYKEALEIGLEGIPFTDPDIHPMYTESNLWPTCMDNSEEFRICMQQYYLAMLDTGTEILRLVALGAGLDEHWFDSMFLPDTLSTLRLLCYPVRPGAPPDNAFEGNTVVCCGEHADCGFLTFLATFHYHGLQIQGKNREWLDVPVRPDSLVMNIGKILSKISNGRFKATNHRVIDIEKERISVPFFLEPKYGANIGRRIPIQQIPDEKVDQPTDDAPLGGKEVKYGQWNMSNMKQYVEYRGTLS